MRGILEPVVWSEEEMEIGTSDNDPSPASQVHGVSRIPDHNALFAVVISVLAIIAVGVVYYLLHIASAA
jgi:hypothetical protein